MQDKLHETIKQLENEKSLWLQKVVCIHGGMIKNMFLLIFSFLKLLFVTNVFTILCLHQLSQLQLPTVSLPALIVIEAMEKTYLKHI